MTVRSTLSVWFLSALLFGLAVTPLSADIIIRKGGGTPLNGNITASSKTELTIEKKVGGPETVPVNEVIDVRWEGEPPKLNLARTNEHGGKLDLALATYDEIAKDAASLSDKSKTDLEFLIARATARQAMGDPGKLEEAAKKLEAFRQTHADNFRDYEALSWLGQVQMAKKDFAAAQATYDNLSRAPWPDYKLAAQAAQGRLLFLQDNVDGALAAYEAVLGTNAATPAEKSRQQEALLGKASCLERQQKFDEALSSLYQLITEVSPEDRPLQAEAYLRQGDCLLAQGKTKESIIAYLHVDVLFDSEKGFHAEALYRLATLWGQVGYPDRAAEAQATLESDYPNSEWFKKLTQKS
ncbi:MAG: tetratricopeptide repeat protein [Planctomycetota bacterium]|nr:tetratricopeptide repeat protein [Planctomycetota bacterium]MDA1212744.1 tetratricopeptide repeat protein [Planctomycetota bacterium]